MSVQPLPRHDARALSVLQLGMGWFPEEAGGLNRFYHDFIRELGTRAVSLRGLVVGSSRVAASTGGIVEGFAEETASLPSRLISARRAVARLCRDVRFDLVASHFALFTYPSLDVIRDVPLVVHFQGPWALEGAAEGKPGLSAAFKRRVENAVYRRASRAIVLSRAFGEILERHYGYPAERIRVVPGGVDFEHFNGDTPQHVARQRLGLPLDRPIVLSPRRLSRRMGLENLIEAAARMRRGHDDVLFVIVGKGALFGELTAAIAHHGLQEQVLMTGYVSDHLLPLYYRAADLTVVPTIALEGFGLIVVESLASGTPVLVTPCGGLPEVVEDLSRRMILPEASAAAIAEGVTGVFGGTLALPSAEECRSFAVRNYSWPSIAEKILSVYQEASR